MTQSGFIAMNPMGPAPRHNIRIQPASGQPQRLCTHYLIVGMMCNFGNSCNFAHINNYAALPAAINQQVRDWVTNNPSLSFVPGCGPPGMNN